MKTADKNRTLVSTLNLILFSITKTPDDAMVAIPGLDLMDQSIVSVENEFRIQPGTIQYQLGMTSARDLLYCC